MNCFEWISRSSDYLDGTLIGATKAEADAHLDTCTECNERHKQYRTLLSVLAQQPRSSLPISMRKAPFASGLPRLDLGLNRSRWQRIPWYIRTPIEAVGIVLFTLIGVSTGPKIRAFYEAKIEKSLSDFSQIFSDSIHPDSVSTTVPSQPHPSEVAAHADDFSSESETDEETDSADNTPTSDQEEETETGDEIRVGNSDIWRFILRTDSPQELKPKITAILTSLEAAPDGKAEGVSAPGGIQFDLTLPKASVPILKRQLFELAPPTPEGLADSPAGETFTWYKIKSKRQIPSGKARVVIWISQI